MEQEDVPVKFRAAYCLTIVSSTYKGKDLSYDAKILSRLSLLLNSDVVIFEQIIILKNFKKPLNVFRLRKFIQVLRPQLCFVL